MRAPSLLTLAFAGFVFAGGCDDKKDAAEPATDKKSVWSRPIDDSAKNLIPVARPRRERR